MMLMMHDASRQSRHVISYCLHEGLFLPSNMTFYHTCCIDRIPKVINNIKQRQLSKSYWLFSKTAFSHHFGHGLFS